MVSTQIGMPVGVDACALGFPGHLFLSAVIQKAVNTKMAGSHQVVILIRKL